MLCGIDVYKTALADLKERFGEPKSFEEYPKTEETAEIVWDKDGAMIPATTNADHIAYAVELRGKRTVLAQTGDGLALGQTIGDINAYTALAFFKKAMPSPFNGKTVKNAGEALRR